jgi:hypothetical protein
LSRSSSASWICKNPINTTSFAIFYNTYITDKIKEFRYDQAKTFTSPSYVSHILSHESTPLDSDTTHLYRQMVGSLMYASCSTRPDITYATNTAARHMQEPTQQDLQGAQRIFRYLVQAPRHGLTYTVPPHMHQGGENYTITAYSDADWAGDKIDRKSTTGYCTFINNNLMSWQSKKQPTVALSTTEAEYMALVEVTKEVLWIKMMLEELGKQVTTPITIYVDNQSTIKFSENDVSRDRTKHIDIKHFFVKDEIEKQTIIIKWVATDKQLADIFTKGLPAPTFINIRDKLVST